MRTSDRLPSSLARQKWADLRPYHQAVTDVCLLFLLPELESGDPFHGFNALIVGAGSLLHTSVPQPDGRRMHDVLTRHPHRRPGSLVFLSDLTADLDRAGLGWGEIDCDWEEVTEALAELAWTDQLPCIALRLTEVMYLLAATGPATRTQLYGPEAFSSTMGREERDAVRVELATTLAGGLQVLRRESV